MKSFALLRTNVGLTTNVKIMVGEDYSTNLESIDSTSDLASNNYKKIPFTKSDYYDEMVPYMFTNLPADSAFAVKYNNDNDIMYNTFDNQYDDIYQMGCRNISDNKNYTQEFECFAPLYIGNDSFPENFVIFRIDGPGVISLNKDNFVSEIVNKLKCVTVFDLTKNTDLGMWINNNFLNNQYFPKSPFYIDFRNLEFSTWNGIDYQVGGYTSMPVFLNSTTEYENTYYDFQKMIYDGYKNNKVIFPNILNFNFLFDDTPATPNSLKTWSINRYMGFYMDKIELVSTVSPYSLPNLKENVVISTGNIISDPNGDNPFVDDWNITHSPYVEIEGSLYLVEQFATQSSPEGISKVKLNANVFSDEIVYTTTLYYKLISQTDFSGLTFSSLNNNLISIDSDNMISMVNQSQLLTNFDSADVWLINIDNIYHVLVKNNNNFYIQSDYAFSVSINQFKYWINVSDPSSTTTIDLSVISNDIPISFGIYRCKFTDIKDFDTSIVETEYARYEYEMSYQLTHTDEPKLYTTNYSSINNPQSHNDYVIATQVVNIPCSSEYTTNGETFRLINSGTGTSYNLSSIWRKNSEFVKWGYQNSLSSSDYPYLLNNSFISEDYNRTVNPFNPQPDRKDRNLDYFYTINSSTYSYSYHSLHIEKLLSGSASGIDTSFNFELDKYLNFGTYSGGTYSFDYFKYLFGKKSSLNSNSYIYNTKKYSTFEVGDDITPNTTLFRGIKFNVYDVEDIITSGNFIETIAVSNNNSYQGYDFSIILSKNDFYISHDPSNINNGILNNLDNQLQWYVINNWVPNTTYSIGDIVNYYDILYIALTQSNISDPNMGPFFDSSVWAATQSIFYTPGFTYSSNDFVYNSGEYYYYNPTGYTYSFWEPFETYNYSDIVIYQNNVWMSTTQSNVYQPGGYNVWRSVPGLTAIDKTDIGISNYYWVSINQQTDWNVIELWSSLYIYGTSSITKPNTTINTPGLPYVFHEDVLYQLGTSSLYSVGDIPSSSNSIWSRVYSIIPDTNFSYSPSDNSIVLLNNRYYKCLSNINNSTLDNGVSIYINKKYKNILINIYINDNTYTKISNCDRDVLYSDIYSKITSANLINSINDLTNLTGFSDYLQYVIINEDNSINVYDITNISSLPTIIVAQTPDQMFSRIESLKFTPQSLKSSQFKTKRFLNNGNISTIDMLNYYNNISLSVDIEKVTSDQSLIANYHGLSNNIYYTLYRYSGYYSPIFYDIQLFEAPGLTSSLIGNYKFDTSLTDFGIMKERVISKVNVNGNILKLRNVPNVNSIYPMIDEFGYTTVNYFIFMSSWDNSYYIQCSDVSQNPSVTTNKTLKP